MSRVLWQEKAGDCGGTAAGAGVATLRGKLAETTQRALWREHDCRLKLRASHSEQPERPNSVAMPRSLETVLHARPA